MKPEPDEIRYVEVAGEKVPMKHFKEYPIGEVILKDIWINDQGIIQRRIKEDKRTYRVLDWRSCRDKTLRRLMYIASFLKRHNLRVYKVTRVVMIDIIMQLLGCSKRTAIDYLAAFMHIADELGAY